MILLLFVPYIQPIAPGSITASDAAVGSVTTSDALVGSVTTSET